MDTKWQRWTKSVEQGRIQFPGKINNMRAIWQSRGSSAVGQLIVPTALVMRLSPMLGGRMDAEDEDDVRFRRLLKGRRNEPARRRRRLSENEPRRLKPLTVAEQQAVNSILSIQNLIPLASGMRGGRLLTPEEVLQEKDAQALNSAKEAIASYGVAVVSLLAAESVARAPRDPTAREVLANTLARVLNKPDYKIWKRLCTGVAGELLTQLEDFCGRFAPSNVQSEATKEDEEDFDYDEQLVEEVAEANRSAAVGPRRAARRARSRDEDDDPNEGTIEDTVSNYYEYVGQANALLRQAAAASQALANVDPAKTEVNPAALAWAQQFLQISGAAPALPAAPTPGTPPFGGPSPFGAGPSPFGAGPSPFGAGPSPFGAGPSPFGAGPSPFGAGPSPFGSVSAGLGGGFGRNGGGPDAGAFQTQAVLNIMDNMDPSRIASKLFFRRGKLDTEQKFAKSAKRATAAVRLVREMRSALVALTHNKPPVAASVIASAVLQTVDKVNASKPVMQLLKRENWRAPNTRFTTTSHRVPAPNPNPEAFRSVF